jgi:hypothetical protein
MRSLSLALVLSISSMAASLHIRVTGETAQPIWTRLEVRGTDGKMYQPPSAILDKTARNRPGGQPYYLGSFVVNGECDLEVPAGRYTVIAEHGLEYERIERAVNVTEQSPAKLALSLKPWIRMRDRGWWSGDMHVHRPLEDAPSLALAEDLNISVAITMWNKRNLWEGKPFPENPVIEASPNHLVTVLNAEDERGGGAWILHGVKRPLDLGVDGRWYPPGIKFVREARAQKSSGEVLPWFDCEKPFWWEVPVMMALATPDSFGVLHNHFDQYGIHASEAWGRPRDQKEFPGWEGFVDYSLGLYYRYLNLGFKLPPSAGTASGVLPNPVGYNRMYVHMDGPFSLDAWYRALREGHVFVTNGPVLFLTTKREGSKLKASVEVVAREPIDRVELVANGRVINRVDLKADVRQYRHEFSVPAADYSWLAARCFLKRGATIRLAHSSPVYLEGKWDARPDAQYFVEWLDELIEQTTSDPKRFAGASERNEILDLYRQARAFYQQKAR